MKICTGCGRARFLSEFHKDGRSDDTRRARCKDCMRVYSHNRADAIGAARRRRWDVDPWLYLFNQKKHKCGNSAEFTLTEQWIREQPKVCPYVGLAFVLEAPGQGRDPHPMAPSFDRVDSSKGYTPENTQLISCFANRAKGSMPDSEFRDFCLCVEETIGGRFD